MVSETVKQQMARYKANAPEARRKLAGTLKRCSKCGVEQSRSEFNNSSSTKDGLMNACKDCRKDYAAAAKVRKDNKRTRRSYAAWCDANAEHLKRFMADGMERKTQV